LIPKMVKSLRNKQKDKKDYLVLVKNRCLKLWYD